MTKAPRNAMLSPAELHPVSQESLRGWGKLSKRVTSGRWLASQTSLISFSLQPSFPFPRRPPLRLSQAIVCLFCPHVLKKHSQHSSLLNYCNSSIKMEKASSARVDLEKAWPFKGGSQVPDLSDTHLMDSLEALGGFQSDWRHVNQGNNV